MIPEIGWRDTLTSGDFRFVRELTGLDTISWHGSRVENWAFSDTVYWNGTAVSTAVYSMSRYGLLQLYVQRAGFNAHGDTATGLLWLQVTAFSDPRPRHSEGAMMETAEKDFYGGFPLPDIPGLAVFGKGCW